MTYEDQAGPAIAGRARVLAGGLGFPEGPVALSDGSVVVVEMQHGFLTRIDPAGSQSVVAETGGGPNGAAIGPDGALYVCNNGGVRWGRRGHWTVALPWPCEDGCPAGMIQRVDISSGSVDALYTSCDGEPLGAPNDIVFDEFGGFYFTDLGRSHRRGIDDGAIYYATAAGDRIVRVIGSLDRPNGIGLAPDGRSLYASETKTGRVWAWDVSEPGLVRKDPGSLGPGNLLHGFAGFQLLDSLAVDSAGNICIGTVITGVISVISPTGELLDEVALPEYDPFVTNICFGGSDLSTAYITSSGLGLIYALPWSRPGLRLAYEDSL
jgi:gluconolactonase